MTDLGGPSFAINTAGAYFVTHFDLLHPSKEGEILLSRLLKEGKSVWQALSDGNDLFLWAQGNQLGITSTKSEVLFPLNGTISFASVSVEGINIHVTAVVNNKTVFYFCVHAATFQIQNELSSTWTSDKPVSQVLKVPSVVSLVAHHSSPSMISVLHLHGVQWRVFAEISLSSEPRFSFLNMAALVKTPVIISFYQAQKTSEMNVIALDIQRIFATDKKSASPIQFQSSFLHVSLTHAVSACVLDKNYPLNVYHVPVTDPLFLSPDNISFGFHAFCAPKSANVSRFEVHHIPLFDKIAKAAPQCLLSLNNPHTQSQGTEFDACVISTPINASGVKSNDVITDVQVTDTLDIDFSSASLWQVCLFSQAQLSSRHTLYSTHQQSTAELTTKSKQALLWEAGVVTQQLSPLLQCLLLTSANATEILSSSTRKGDLRYQDPASYAVENIQDVFEWSLGDNAISLQQSFRTQVRQLIGSLLPRTLMQCESKVHLVQQHPAQVACVTLPLEEICIMAQSLRDISETLFQRKMVSLTQERILQQGSAQRGDDIVFANDLASHSVAQLQLYRRLAVFQRQYMDVMLYLWQHPFFDFTAFAVDSHPEEEILTRLLEVIPAVDGRFLPKSINASASLVYKRLCRDILRTKASSSYTSVINEPQFPQLPSSFVNKDNNNMMVDEENDDGLYDEIDDKYLVNRDEKDKGRHPASFEIMCKDVLLPLLTASDHNQHSDDQNRKESLLGSALLTPLVLLYDKIDHLLQHQIYNELTMSQFEDILEWDIHQLRRVWLYVIMLSFVVSFKRQQIQQQQVKTNIFAHEFIEQLYQILSQDDASSTKSYTSTTNYSLAKEELHMLLGCVLVDLDDTTLTPETNPTHFQHVVSLFTTNHFPDEYLLHPQPLVQYPYLKHLFEHVVFAGSGGEQVGANSGPRHLSLLQTTGFGVSVPSDATRHRINDILSLQSIGFAVVQRWVCRGHYAAAYHMQKVTPYPRHIRQSVLTWVSSIPEVTEAAHNSEEEEFSSWRRVWEEAKVKAEAIYFPSESLLTLQEITRFICSWTIVHGYFASLLESEDLQYVEIEEIILFLSERAEVEISRGLCPAAAVDTLVGFLLQHRRVAQAKQWHIRHLQQLNLSLDNIQQAANSSKSSPPLLMFDVLQEDVTLEMKRLLFERHLLIEAASVPGVVWSIPEVDYNLARNLQRGHHIFQRVTDLTREKESTATVINNKKDKDINITTSPVKEKEELSSALTPVKVDAAVTNSQSASFLQSHPSVARSSISDVAVSTDAIVERQPFRFLVSPPPAASNRNINSINNTRAALGGIFSANKTPSTTAGNVGLTPGRNTSALFSRR